MKKNMGVTDKTIRIVIAILLAVLYFTEVISGTIGAIGLSIAGVFILTSLINFCPLYAIFGIKTCKTNV